MTEEKTMQLYRAAMREAEALRKACEARRVARNTRKAWGRLVDAEGKILR